MTGEQLILLAVVVLVLGVALIGLSRLVGREKWRPEGVAPDTSPTVYLTESVTFTGFGVFCAIAMAATNLIFVIAIFAVGQRSAIQETVMALLWISINQSLSVGIIVGRRRRYTVSKGFVE